LVSEKEVQNESRIEWLGNPCRGAGRWRSIACVLALLGRLIPHLEARHGQAGTYLPHRCDRPSRLGESEAPADGYALANLTADAEGVISALNLKRYVLVGHSMGGKVAQLMASRRPAGLAGLILVAPSPPQPMAMPAQAREMMAGAYVSRETVEATIDNVLTSKPLSAEDREQVIADSLRGAPPAKVAWPRATSLEDITAQVGAINVPTIIIVGELDRIDSPELLKAELLSRVPQAVMHVLPGTGHLSMLESADALVPFIEQFCNSLTGSPR
jgi:pimeloyl-ACP methyl ester carboxylesterase